MDKQRPAWLKVKLRPSPEYLQVQALLERLALLTVCQEANCPNAGECFGKGTATFLILGKVCTRNCAFCAVGKGQPQAVDGEEPQRVALAVKELGLRHVVITSVTRDDLADGGAAHFAAVIARIKAVNGPVAVEALIPDFRGDRAALAAVVRGKPAVINHNLETVPRLYPAVRPQACYRRSLALLEQVKEADEDILTKSGIMLGLGETEQEVIGVLRDLRLAGCDMVTLGQYLAPSDRHHPVIAYIPPEQFVRFNDIGMAMGFKHISSGPLVRSSYHAAEGNA